MNYIDWTGFRMYGITDMDDNHTAMFVSDDGTSRTITVPCDSRSEFVTRSTWWFAHGVNGWDRCPYWTENGDE